MNKIIQQANEVAARIADSSPMIVFLTGASGVGKTTLVNQFCRRLTGEHLQPELVNPEMDN
ncbi:MAG: ATP-binding protein [Proteobacteria bacterium]|nr:ATP-binding protein [Pseudomonadota bacterium]